MFVDQELFILQNHSPFFASSILTSNPSSDIAIMAPSHLILTILSFCFRAILLPSHKSPSHVWNIHLYLFLLKQTKSNYWSFSKTPFKRRYLLLLPLPFLFCPCPIILWPKKSASPLMHSNALSNDARVFCSNRQDCSVPCWWLWPLYLLYL